MRMVPTARISLGVIAWATVIYFRSIFTAPYQPTWFLGQLAAALLAAAVGWWICESRVRRHYTVTRRQERRR